MTLTLPSFKATEAMVTELGTVLKVHPGTTEVRMKLTKNRSVEILQLSPEFRVNPNPALFGDLKVLLGPSCLD